MWTGAVVVLYVAEQRTLTVGMAVHMSNSTHIYTYMCVYYTKIFDEDVIVFI